MGAALLLSPFASVRGLGESENLFSPSDGGGTMDRIVLSRQAAGQWSTRTRFWHCVRSHKWMNCPPGSAFLPKGLSRSAAPAGAAGHQLGLEPRPADWSRWIATPCGRRRTSGGIWRSRRSQGATRASSTSRSGRARATRLRTSRSRRRTSSLCLHRFALDHTTVPGTG